MSESDHNAMLRYAAGIRREERRTEREKETFRTTVPEARTKPGGLGAVDLSDYALERFAWLHGHVARTEPGEVLLQWLARARAHLYLYDGEFPAVRFWLEVRDEPSDFPGFNIDDGWYQVFGDGDWGEADAPGPQLVR